MNHTSEVTCIHQQPRSGQKQMRSHCVIQYWTFNSSCRKRASYLHSSLLCTVTLPARIYRGIPTLVSTQLQSRESLCFSDIQRLNVPNLLSVLVDAAVASEEAHPGYGCDALGHPLVLVAIGLINEGMRLDVAVEVVRHQVVVTMVPDSGNQGAKVVGQAKRALFNLDKDLLQVGVDGVRAKVVGMAQVFHIFGEVSEQKDVAFTNFTCDFNLQIELACYR